MARVFNARRPDRFPAGVLQAESEEDVVAGVRLARERGLKVSVRAGGHSWAAWSLRDDALLIDLGAMREMTFDPATGIATASPGLKGGAEFTPFLTRHGRVFTGGHCPGSGWVAFSFRAGRAGTRAATGGRARTSWASMWCAPTARCCTPTRIRTPICCGRPAEPARVSSA